MTKYFLILQISLLLLSCKKNIDMQCDSTVVPKADFSSYEILGDTAFIADTIYRNNYVRLKANANYSINEWSIDTNPITWTGNNVSFNFSGSLGDILIKFKGVTQVTNPCNTLDSSIFFNTRKITILEQSDRSILTISPLVGKYKGSFNDIPLDSFIVKIEYFDSTKYDVGVTGSRNFYWISNIPNGYTSLLGWAYPELKNGQPVEMGYKCFRFGSSSNAIQGRGWLNNDTLQINYGNDLNGRKKFKGKKIN
jgi:hypothetical protein